MSEYPGPRDAFGRPQDYVPGRDDGHVDPHGYGPPQQGMGGGGPFERRGGFSTFPFPSYSTTTRNGTGITVAGCCLPLPLGCLTLTLSAAGLATYRLVRARG